MFLPTTPVLVFVLCRWFSFSHRQLYFLATNINPITPSILKTDPRIFCQVNVLSCLWQLLRDRRMVTFLFISWPIKTIGKVKKLPLSAEIPAGVNIAYMCTQIKEAVEEEQNKTLWVPSVQAWPLPPLPARRPPQPRHKSVTFCTHCKLGDAYSSDVDVRYYSDPGRENTLKQKKKKKKEPVITASTDSDLKYYSEPDAKNYFEIDYEFLKELRKIARNNCPKCKRKRSRKTAAEPGVQTRRPQRSSKLVGNYVFCNGRYHSDKEHCQLCCRICNRSTDTLDSLDEDQYSLVSHSYSQPSKQTSSNSRSTSRSRSSKTSHDRKNSIQSNKSVSFLESSNDESKDEPNYTAKSFTNDLKKFLLKPTAPKLSLRDKFMISLKQEFDKKKSPKLKAIKGLWKSYWKT